MGCGSSTESAPESAQHLMIEKSIRNHRAQLGKEIKVLLLGAGESGKSTIVKQMRRLYAQPFTQAERDDFRDVIFANVASSALVVLESLDEFQLVVPIELKPSIDLLLEVHLNNPHGQNLGTPQGGLEPELAAAVKAVVTSEPAQVVFERSTQVQLNDSAEYFFRALPRLVAPGYNPTDQDILHARVRSTGIVETRLKVQSLIFKVIDVGGQRSERKKWIHCFENVHVLLFVLAISEFAQRLAEDSTVGRFTEALQLWDSISNSRWFSKTSTILFLNKIDLFQQRLLKLSFVDFVPEYPRSDPNTFEATTSWLTQRLRTAWRGRDPLHVHLTCATDENQVAVVIFAVSESIVRRNLEQSGLI